MSSPSINNGSNNVVIPQVPNNGGDSQLKGLLAPNAYQNVAGLLIGVLAKLSSEELKLRQANAQGSIASAQAQTVSAQAQGRSAMDGAMSEAVGESASAVASAGSSAHGVSGMKQLKTMNNEHTSTVDEKTAQINKLRSPTGIGDRKGIPEGVTKEEHIKTLEHERSEAMSKRSHALETHREHIQHMGGLSHVVQGLGKMGTALSTGQTQAASATAQNAKEMAQQVGQDTQSNSKSNDDVAAQALQEIGQVGRITVAAARG